MFDIGFTELVVIALVALVVLGPERLPKAARFTGLWVRRARAQWYSVKDELERELAAEELKRSLHDAQSALRDTEQKIRDSGAEAQREFERMRASVVSKADPGAPVADGDAASGTTTTTTTPSESESDEPRDT